MIHALKHVDTDVIIGTRASFNILIAQRCSYTHRDYWYGTHEF